MSNSLILDHFDGPDLCLNCLQGLSKVAAGGEIFQRIH